LNKATVEGGSEISNTNTDGTNIAEGKSVVISGISANNAQIKNSTITNTNTGVDNTAKGESEANSGINLGY